MTQTATRQAKSASLGLSFPYDWSNPNLADDILIDKVVERGIFVDLVRVSIHFGVDRVQGAVDRFVTNERDRLDYTRMMKNIRKGLAC